MDCFGVRYVVLIHRVALADHFLRSNNILHVVRVAFQWHMKYPPSKTITLTLGFIETNTLCDLHWSQHNLGIFQFRQY